MTCALRSDIEAVSVAARYSLSVAALGFVAGVDLRTGKIVHKHRNGTVDDSLTHP